MVDKFADGVPGHTVYMSTRTALAAKGVAPVEGMDPLSRWAGLPGNGAPAAPPAPPAAPPAPAEAAAPPLDAALTKAGVAKKLAKVKVDEYVMSKDGHISVVVEREPQITAYQIIKDWSDKDTQVRAAPALLLRLRPAPPRPADIPAQVYAWNEAKTISFDAIPLDIVEKLPPDSKLLTKRMRDSLADSVYMTAAKKIKSKEHTKYLTKKAEAKKA